MTLFDKNLDIPEYCYNNPEIQDINGNTMAMRYAYKRMIPPDHWNHNPTLKNNNGLTVAMILSLG